MTHAPRVIVLMYHGLGGVRDTAESRFLVGPRRFADQMAALARAGFKAIAIDEMLDALANGGRLPAGALVLTFDDGYRSVREYAWPVLNEIGWPFTVFLVSDLIGTSDGWTMVSSGRPVLQPLLGADEILAMQRAGCSFQSHSRSHPRLSQLDDLRLQSELVGSREALSNMLGEPVRYIAYPFGDADARVRAAAESAGYAAAFSTRSGFNNRDTDRFNIRRIEVVGTDTPAMLLRKVRLGTNDGSLRNMVRYWAGRVGGRLYTGQSDRDQRA